MTWLAWRQLRAQALPVYVGVLGLAVVLAVTGPRLARLPSDALYDSLTPSDRRLYWAGLVVLAVAPAVIGAFWGAPLVARELEAGTHRMVWNQGVTRARWLACKLAMTLVAASVGVGALSLAVSWWASPVDGAVGTSRGSLPGRLTPVSFSMRALDPVALTVFALSLGVLLGVLLRRSLPAMAVTVGVVVLAQVALPLWVRPHLLPASSKTSVVSRSTLDGISGDPGGSVVTLTVRSPHAGDWVLSQETVDAAGDAVPLPVWFKDCVAPPAVPQNGSSRAEAPDLSACFDRLTAEGFRQHVVYQPVGRFWPLQWAESGLLLLVSGVLVLVAFRRVRALS